MSTCVSSSGEYSEHKLTSEGGSDDFVCRRCFVFDEQAAMIALGKAEARADDLTQRLDAAESDVGWLVRQRCAVIDVIGSPNFFRTPQDVMDAVRAALDGSA